MAIESFSPFDFSESSQVKVVSLSRSLKKENQEGNASDRRRGVPREP